jgi:hypothetical protein
MSPGQKNALGESKLAGSDQHNTSSGNSSEPVSLDVLWEALPFTPAIKHGSHGHLEYSHTPASDQAPQLLQQQQQQQQAEQVLQPPVITAVTASAQLVSAPRLQQPILAPLLHPELVNSHHQDISIMASLAAETIAAAITADEARAGYEQAFAAVAAPAGTAWHLRKFTTASSWQQRQQKGAEYVDAGSGSSSRGLAGEEGLSAVDEQKRSLQAQAAAQQLMTHALQLLKDTGRLADCGTEDDSLPPLLQSFDVAGDGGVPGSRVLLAAALQQSEEAMPNMVLQLVLVRGSL